MRANFTFLLLLSGILMIGQSCSKSAQEEMVLSTIESDEVISASISAGSAYELPLTRYGSVSIYRQAKNHLESSAGIDAKTRLMVYKYVPRESFRGEDEVILKSSKSVRSYSAGNGCNFGTDGSERVVASYITIKLKVTD